MRRGFMLLSCLLVATAAHGAPVLPDGTDADADGWAVADNDCCDNATQCATPALVNPGAIELPANGVDDDCDASVDVVPSTACSVAQALTGVTALQAAQAADLCQTTVANPPTLALRRWGIVSSRHTLADGSTPSAAVLTNLQNFQTSVQTSFVNGNPPRANATLVALGTGNARTSAQPGFSPPEPGVDRGNAVAPQVIVDAGACQQANTAFDSAVVELVLRVPTNVVGIAVDYRFFNADYPFACTFTDDQAQILLTTQTVTRQNIAIDALGRPASVNAAAWDSCLPSPPFTCPGGTAGIVGTGFDFASDITSAGAATTWNTARGAVPPGGDITLAFVVFEGGDSLFDSLLLFDNVRWITDRVFASGYE